VLACTLPSRVRRPTLSDAASIEYCRHRPELGVLYQVVAETYRTLEAASEQGVIAALPSFVKDEFEAYLGCGILAHGFGFLQCESPGCRQKLLVAFSCKGRGWCPSCIGRRMCQSAANWVEHVLPHQRVRQFVLTFPFELRARLAYDRELLSRVTKLFNDCVLGFYRRTLRDLYRAGSGQGGTITVTQRTSSDLRLNPHLHQLALDGVFVEEDSGELVFHPLPSLSNSDVAELLDVVCTRMLALLEREGVIEDRRDPRLADDGFAEREPALASLASAAVTGNMPAGPEARQRVPIRLQSDGSNASVSGLSARQCGFSLHAATTAPAHDARARETLCKYVLRPPLAEQRVKKLPSGFVRIELKRAFSDGTVAIDLDPLSLLCRLAAAVPPPRAHLVRYAGVLSAAHRWRQRIVPPPPEAESNDEACDHGHPLPDANAVPEPAAKPPTHRSGYRPWRELLRRTFQVDLDRCAQCGARLVLRALVTAAESVARFLRNIGEDPNPPPIAPARAPPFFRMPALRRSAAELSAGTSAQMELFGA
jgi:hypothetical protein